MAPDTIPEGICVLCGNHALDLQPEYGKDGAPRAAAKVECRRCGSYIITSAQRDWIGGKFKTNRDERVRLSAATRNASERGESLELSSESVRTLLESVPRPDPPEAADLLLAYIDRHTKAGGKGVHLDKRRDYPLVYADSEEAFLFIVRYLADKGWIQRLDKSDRPQYRLTMDGYERLKGIRAARRVEANMVQPKDYDIFLSHASEDKETIARPLYEALVKEGVTVWFDEIVMELGDSLRRRIDAGLARCRYGVVILSPRFLEKQWTQRELDGLVARETSSGEKAILPIWHELDAQTLLRYSPPLADRLAGRSKDGILSLVKSIRRVLDK